MRQSTASFLVTPEEFYLLTSVVYLEPFLDEILSKVKKEEGGLRLKFPYDDLEETIGALDHHMGYQAAQDKERVRALIMKLEGYKKLRSLVQDEKYKK